MWLIEGKQSKQEFHHGNRLPPDLLVSTTWKKMFLNADHHPSKQQMAQTTNRYVESAMIMPKIDGWMMPNEVNQFEPYSWDGISIQHTNWRSVWILALQSFANFWGMVSWCFPAALERWNIASKHTTGFKTLNLHLHHCWNLGVSRVMGVPQNGWFVMENPTKMDDLGAPPFMETTISKGQQGLCPVVSCAQKSSNTGPFIWPPILAYVWPWRWNINENHGWLVVGPPLWKIWVRQLGWLATQY